MSSSSATPTSSSASPTASSILAMAPNATHTTTPNMATMAVPLGSFYRPMKLPWDISEFDGSNVTTYLHPFPNPQQDVLVRVDTWKSASRNCDIKGENPDLEDGTDKYVSNPPQLCTCSHII